LWFKQFECVFNRHAHAQAGENPELRGILYRLARLLHAPVTPLFVFDGPARPSIKRGKHVVPKAHWLTSGMQELITAFGFFWYTVSQHTASSSVRIG
jgi:Holliday junction resolvase YEN1